MSAHKNRKGKLFIQNAIMKYGWESFTVEILEIFKNFDKLVDNPYLLNREAYFIELFNSTNRDRGHNLCAYSSDRTGIPLTDETKEKLRRANLGKKHSKETKLKISKSHLGKVLTEKTKEKMRKPKSKEAIEKTRQANLGRPLSEEHKEKLKLAHLGKTFSEESKKKMKESKLGKKHSEERKEQMRNTRLRNKLYKLNKNDGEQ